METNQQFIEPADALKEFFEKFEVPKDPKLWEKLVIEEAAEVTEAYANLLKEICDMGYVIQGLEAACADAGVEMPIETLEKHLRAPWAVLNTLDIGGLEPDLVSAVFDAVHTSNMSKLDDDGKPVRREDGKVLKGPNYKAPDILSIVTEFHK